MESSSSSDSDENSSDSSEDNEVGCGHYRVSKGGREKEMGGEKEGGEEVGREGR